MDKNIYITNLSQYTAPDVMEVKHKGWVEYKIKNDRKYSHPNGYYDYLLDRAKGSVTNGAAIGGFTKLIYGQGLYSKDASRNPEQWARIISLIKADDVKKIAADRKKLMMAAIQVTKVKGEIKSVTHFPMKTLLPEIMNEEGEIENWYYHPNWKEKRGGDQPEKIPAYGYGKDSGNEIYVIKAYNGCSEYFGEDDGYTACLPYCVLEEEIADFQVNDAQNGFTPTTIINFNNGIPDKEKMRDVAREVESKTTGATGKKTIVSFNEDESKRATVEKIAMDNAPEHYAYLSQECQDKILAGHRAPSELLGFNKDGNGFSNNAEELKNKFKAFENFEVKPYQLEITDALEEIFASDQNTIKLSFKSLNPFDFEPEVQSTTLSKELSDSEGMELLENLKSSTLSEEWELVDKREYNEDNESIDSWAKRLIKPKKKGFLNVIKSYPNKESYLDKSVYKVRYEYGEKYSSGKTRGFCAAMMRRTKNGVVYRKEDIDQASFSGVNRKFGHKGMPYDLFKYKGGVNCGHYWIENLYRLKTKTDGTPYEDKSLSSSEEVDEIPKSYKPSPRGWERANSVEKDRADKGHHPNYYK